MKSPTVMAFAAAMIRVYGPANAKLKYYRAKGREHCARNHVPDTAPHERVTPIPQATYRGRGK